MGEEAVVVSKYRVRVFGHPPRNMGRLVGVRNAEYGIRNTEYAEVGTWDELGRGRVWKELQVRLKPATRSLSSRRPQLPPARSQQFQLVSQLQQLRPFQQPSSQLLWPCHPSRP